jgi:NAD(P)-dependent dehydrogenase (short-subunit alcohol dehydrogenase family)
MGLALAREGQPHGIRVHTIAPGVTETDMFRGIATKEKYPQEWTLEPEDVAQTIVQCICGQLKHTSGEVIYLHKRVS